MTSDLAPPATAVGAATPNAASGPSDRLRVLTLNIWNRQGPWEERLPVIRAGIRALGPDVVGLQEDLTLTSLGLSLAQQIADGLGYEVASGPANDFGGLVLGNAVLSRWPIAEQRNFPLPVDAGQGGRALLFTRIAAPFGALPFFCTHLDWEFHLGIWRQRQVAFIAERVHELCPTRAEDYPPVLVGDFNAEPLADEIRFLVGHTAIDGRTVYFADCFRIAGDGTPGYTFARRNPFAAPLREPDRRIDYVFVRGPDKHGRGEPLHCRVVLDTPGPNGVFASDHFGVYAELSLR